MATPYPTHSEGIPVAYVTIHDDLLCPSCADAREYGDIKGGKHILITDTGHVCTDCWTDLEPLPELDLNDLPRFDRIEIYEDNAGRIHFHPVGQGITIDVPSNVDALSDCRLYGCGWFANDAPEGTHPVNAMQLGRARLVASWDAANDAIELEVEPEQMGHAAREYLSLVICPEPDEEPTP